MEESREQYLSTLTLYQEISTLVTNPTLLLNKDSSQRASREREIVRLAGELLAAVEAAQCLKLHATTHTTAAGYVLGITDGDFQASVMERLRGNQQVLVQALLPKIEAALRDKCDKIDSFAMPEAEQFVVGECSQLPQVVAERQAQLTGLNREIHEVAESTQLLRYQLSQCVVALVTKFQQYVTQVVIQTNGDRIGVEAEWLMAEIKSLQLKFRSLEHSVMAQTYNDQTLPALQKIRDRLDISLHEARTHQTQLSSKVAEFDSLGTPFADLASQYGEMQHQIQTIQEDLKAVSSA